MTKETGYPHIDKPWLKIYTDEQRKMFVPNGNMIDYLRIKNAGYGSNVVEEYYGRKFTFDEQVGYRTDLAARVLSQIGVKTGDVIGTLIPNIPEAGQIWFGATELGAISDFLDPRPDGMDEKINAQKILDLLRYENVKHIVALDACYLMMLKPIEAELKEIGIDTIVLVSADDSMSLRGKLDYLHDVIQYNKIANSRKSESREEKSLRISNYRALLNKLKMQRELEENLERAISTSPLKVLKYRDLVHECQNSFYQKVSDIDLPNYIGHTSGTSGARPKPIMMTSRKGITLAEQCEHGHFSSERGKKVFHLLPFFAPAGAYSNYFVNLATGAKTIDIAEFYIGDFGYLIKKYRPNDVLATPAWLTNLPDYPLLEREHLDYLEKMIYVGDSTTVESINRLRSWTREHRSDVEISSAHGMSELGGCGSYATGEYNKAGSVGIPLPNTIYGIVDPNIDDELVPLKFEDGQEFLEGELVISAPNVTDGKLGSEIIVQHSMMDGEDYIRTRDIVRMDRDGVFYHLDRKDRSFTRIDGYKIKPYEIEKIIESNPYVARAIITPYFDQRKNGMMPKCHIILTDEASGAELLEVVSDIVYNTIIGNPDMSSRQIPSIFKFRESFPLTKNNKVDFKSLASEEPDGSEINVDVEETNLSVGEINISGGSKVLKLK